MFDIQHNAPTESLLGTSPAILRVGEQLRRAAQTDVPVLITGESGTGKELSAKAVHNLSARRHGRFLKINCPSVPYEIFEGKLLGTGTAGDKPETPSSIEDHLRPHRDTLFLDEIAELDLPLQSRLLRAVNGFPPTRFGLPDGPPAEVRLVCATSHNLEEAVAAGRFRIDLFHRIDVLHIDMPALRDRISDIPILMEHFIRTYAEKFSRTPAALRQPFIQLLQCYHWPGNIRELENMAKRYVLLGGEEHLTPVLRGAEATRPASPPTVDLDTPLRIQTRRAVQHLERNVILGALQTHAWNRTKTAHALGISYRALLHKIKEVGLPSVRSTRPPLEQCSLQGQEKVGAP